MKAKQCISVSFASNSHLSDENSTEHHPIPSASIESATTTTAHIYNPASIESGTKTTTPIANPTKLSYSAKKRLAVFKKKQSQLSSPHVSNTTTNFTNSIPKSSNTTSAKFSTTSSSVTQYTPLSYYALKFRGPPCLQHFNQKQYSTLRRSRFRFDNSISPTWSILGNSICLDDNDRIIINIPSKLLHLVTYDNNSPPGCYFHDNNSVNGNPVYADSPDDYYNDNITRINFHSSDSDSFILSNYHSCHDDISNDDNISDNKYENKNINNKSCTY